MNNAHPFLTALTVALGVAAITTVLFQRLKQPVVLGYIIAGLIVGPHVPVPLVADPATVQTLSELGVVLLMFSLGLEFSLRKLVRIGPTAGLTALVQCSLMLWAGFVTGRALGWTDRESLFTGAVIAISSTTIIARVFDEQRIGGALRALVVGVLIVEDLVAVVLMAGLTALSSGPGLSAGGLALAAVKLLGFLAALLAVGLLTVPRAVRAVNRLNRRETSLVVAVGICFGVAWLAQALGFSVALGAFVAGSLVAESGEARAIEPLVAPVRDLFAAVFFVSVGMMLDPALLAEHWRAILVLTAVVVVGKIVSVSLGAFFTGNGIRTSVQTGMSLAQIGEFSFIIASLGLTLGATRSFLYPVAVSVSALTTLTTPWLIRSADPVAGWIDRHLPKRLQTFAALYGSWLERLRSNSAPQTASRAIRRGALMLLVDGGLLAAIVIGTSVGLDTATDWLAERVAHAQNWARLIVLASAAALCVPFAAGIVRVARRLGILLAQRGLPPAMGGGPDLSMAPRRTLVVVLQVALVLVVAAPLVALTQPFLPGAEAGVVLLALTAALAVRFWGASGDLQGHVRAGAEAILDALAAQARSPTQPHGAEAALGPEALDQIRELLPGLGEPVTVRLRPGSAACGRNLRELHVRARTGATVLAIARDGSGVALPRADESLRASDILVLAGASDAVESAKTLLLGSGHRA